jgi:hypothetical protein
MRYACTSCSLDSVSGSKRKRRRPRARCRLGSTEATWTFPLPSFPSTSTRLRDAGPCGERSRPRNIDMWDEVEDSMEMFDHQDQPWTGQGLAGTGYVRSSSAFLSLRVHFVPHLLTLPYPRLYVPASALDAGRSQSSWLGDFDSRLERQGRQGHDDGSGWWG